MDFPPRQPTSAPNHRGFELLAFLSTFCGLRDILGLHDLLNTHSADDIIKLSEDLRRSCTFWRPVSFPVLADLDFPATALTDSQRYSIVSILSSLSSSSTGSRDSRTQAPSFTETSRPLQWTTEAVRSSFSPSANPATSPHSSLPVRAFPASECHTPASLVGTKRTLFFCITCKKRYKTSQLLKRHYDESCESVGIWICPLCPEQSPKEYIRPGSCQQHIDDIHGKEPGHKQGFRPVLRRYPDKRAWGCPVCGAFFDTRVRFHEHTGTHYNYVRLDDRRPNEIEVDNWAFDRQVFALVHSEELRHAASRYNWVFCHTWPEDEGGRKSLLFALERLTLPRNLESHPHYAGLDAAEAIVAYAFRIGLSWNPDSLRDLSQFMRPLEVSPTSISSHLAPWNSVKTIFGSQHPSSVQHFEHSSGVQYYPRQEHELAAAGYDDQHQALPIPTRELELGRGVNLTPDAPPQTLQDLGLARAPRKTKSQRFKYAINAAVDTFSRQRSKSSAHPEAVQHPPRTDSLNSPNVKPYETRVDTSSEDQQAVFYTGYTINAPSFSNMTRDDVDQLGRKRHSAMSVDPASNVNNGNPPIDPTLPDFPHDDLF